MRVVHLSTYDLFGGAAKSAFRLHEALVESGLDSTMLVRRRDSQRADVKEPEGAVMKLWLRAQRRSDRLPLWFKGDRAALFSPGWVPDGLGRQLQVLRPDIIHLHWVADGFFQVESLRKIGVPIIWTMHDMWPFTGGCHFSGSCQNFVRECGRCPLLNSKKENDLSRAGWARRRRAGEGKKVQYVAPSRWLAGGGRESSLLREAEISVIPYGIDTGIFAPGDRAAARRRWGLPPHKRLLLAGSAQLGDPRKGFAQFRQSMQLFRGLPGATDVEVVLFGGDAPAAAELKEFNVHYLGVIPNDAAMASVFAAADIFVAPSLEDNLPNTVIEAMAAGVPVVAYDAGGIPEIVDHGVTGLLAPVGQPAQLTAAFSRLVNDPEFLRACGQRAREKALRTFAKQDAARAYRELYAQLLQPA